MDQYYPTMPSLPVRSAMGEVVSSFATVVEAAQSTGAAQLALYRKFREWSGLYDPSKPSYLADVADVYRSGIRALDTFATEIDADQSLRCSVLRERYRLDSLCERAARTG